MLDQQGFNLWADHYDQTVQVSDDNNEYPFAGYKDILNKIYNVVMAKEHSNVLDIGFGTGVLTTKLYEAGHNIDGLDFSSQMIDIAKAKMPEARLLEWDIANGIHPEFLGDKYDFIVSTYTLHHLTYEEKISFIEQLSPLLKDDGKILIGDVAFETREELNDCRENNIDVWDHDEFYLVYEESELALGDKYHCEFHKISHCGGVMTMKRRE